MNKKPSTKSRAHVELEELVRLQFSQHPFSFLPKQPIHSLLSGRHASRLRGRGLQFEELRHYRPGDDIRSMDWRATARLRKPHIRVFSEERERTVLFIVDQRNGMHFGSERATKAVAACELAALGAWRTFSMGDRTAAIIFNDDETVYIPPHRSKATVHRICAEMATMNQKLNSQNLADKPEALNEALRQATNLAKHDFLIVLATDCHGADAKTRKLVSQLAAHNDMIATLVYDPLGIQLPNLGNLNVTDGEKQFTIPRGHGFQDNYKNAFVEWARKIHGHFGALKVPILPICTHDEVGDQILSALGFNK